MGRSEGPNEGRGKVEKEVEMLSELNSSSIDIHNFFFLLTLFFAPAKEEESEITAVQPTKQLN